MTLPNHDDSLSLLFHQTHLSTKVFFVGTLCQTSSFNTAEPVGHLHLVRAGRMQLLERDLPVASIEEASVVFYAGSCPHQLVPVDERGVDVICAELDLGQVYNRPLLKAFPTHLVRPLSSFKALASTVELLIGEATGSALGRQAAIDRLMEYFVIQLLRELVDQRHVASGLLAGMADLKLNKALLAMHESPAKAWTLDALAQVAGMSRTRFAAHFLAVVGQTAFDYLADWRLAIAQKQLLQGQSVQSVARAVGYNSPAAFNRVFLRRQGLAPLTWRAQQTRSPG